MLDDPHRKGQSSPPVTAYASKYFKRVPSLLVMYWVKQKASKRAGDMVSADHTVSHQRVDEER